MGAKASDYDGLMMRFRLVALAALLSACVVGTPAGAQEPRTAAALDSANSGLDAELFYQLLLGELNVQSEEPAAGFALILDAARKTNDPTLYQRSVELAFQGRNGDAALQAARAWKQAFPQSREANRYVLQILVALNRIPESAEPLKTEISLADPKDRPAVIAAVARSYSRATDKKQAATVVEQALADYMKAPDTGPVAWSSVGRLRLAAGDTAGAMEAARRGQAINPGAEAPVLLALELMESKLPDAEALVRTYLQGKPLPEIRMAYARALLDGQRQAEALVQVQAVTRERPDLAEAWLAQGTLLVQDNQLAPAEAAIRKYIELMQAQPASEEKSRGMAQAYLSMAQIYERRRDFVAANAWLDRIENSQDLLQAQNRRASILARQGKMDEARKVIRALPERTPADARMKVMAEIQLLRDNKMYPQAYELLARAIAQDPSDSDLLYDQAMLAEKMGKFDDMEKLLRELIVKKPDYHHAYNALGFSLAERNVRLPEAKQLVQKALEFAPGDPFISDSLAWVEYRMGNKAEALRILQAAYKERPDAEIAAHLGEVLWTLGQRDQAQSIFREGILINAENETLVETMKRLKVKP
jgi:tetratricopeptide (TPR) repeat protein